jgi:hypothetical protein
MADTILNQPLTASEALAKSNLKRAANKARVTKVNVELRKEGAREFLGYIFPFAPSKLYPGGHFALVPCQVSTLALLGLNLATKDNTFFQNKAGQIRKYKQVVITTMRYSFITRKSKTSVKANKPQKQGYTREWHVCPIPKNAREIDILKFVSTWTKQPEVIEINGQAILMKKPKAAIFQGLKARSGKAASTVAAGLK